jgi:hypothetical protein
MLLARAGTAARGETMSQRNEALFDVHGVSPEHTPQQGVAVGNAMLIALGAGGPLSAKEMDEFVSIATAYGATPDAIESWKRFEYLNGKLSEHIQLEPRLARHMLYEAIRICSADAPPGAIAKLAQVARVLGVDAHVLASLEAVATAEVALRQARADVSAAANGRPKGTPPGVTAGLATIAEKEGQLRKMRIVTMDSGKPG